MYQLAANVNYANQPQKRHLADIKVTVRTRINYNHNHNILAEVM